MADPRPGQRYRHGWIPLYPQISKSDLSTGDARRSREVSAQEFERVAAVGAAQMQKMKRSSAPTTGLNANWAEITKTAFSEAQKDWGGATFDAHTGKALKGNEDKYAITVRDPGMATVSVPEKASRKDLAKAMGTAKNRYAEILQRPDHYLGVFHDNDKGTIDIDPVFVTADKTHVETIGAYTHATGGAYHFASGDGFWPPHVKDSEKAA